MNAAQRIHTSRTHVVHGMKMARGYYKMNTVVWTFLAFAIETVRLPRALISVCTSDMHDSLAGIAARFSFRTKWAKVFLLCFCSHQVVIDSGNLCMSTNASPNHLMKKFNQKPHDNDAGKTAQKPMQLLNLLLFFCFKLFLSCAILSLLLFFLAFNATNECDEILHSTLPRNGRRNANKGNGGDFAVILLFADGCRSQINS